MKENRFLFDMGLTTILTSILFSLIAVLIYPYLSKGHLPLGMEFNLTMIWFFLFSYLPLVMIIGPLHYLSLTLGEWAGPVILIMVATIVGRFIPFDLSLVEMVSPFFLVTPLFCLLSKILRYYVVRFNG